MLSKSKYLIILVALILHSCCSGFPENIGKDHYGKEYNYQEYSHSEIKSALRNIMLENVKYIVPYNTELKYYPLYFEDSSIYSQFHKYKNGMNYEADTIKNIEYNYIELLNFYGEKYTYIYLEQYNILIICFVFGKDNVKEFPNLYNRLYLTTIYFFEDDIFIPYLELDNEERHKISTIFEKEIIVKLNEKLKLIP